MDIRPIEFSIVVVANDCNPTILNRDFLRDQNIVPDEWGWSTSGPLITTPPYAVVNYDSGVSISVESNKFQIVNGLNSGELFINQLKHIANKYIYTLPHVHYTGVGHNIKMFLDMDNAEEFLKSRFLQTGDWDNEAHPLSTSSYKFTYPLEEGGITITIEGAKHIDTSGDEPKETAGIIVSGNYHRNCRDYPGVDVIVKNIGHAESDWNNFQDTMLSIIGNKK